MLGDKANIGLFCDAFPPVMDGVSVCMENYAYWLQKMVGGVDVITPNVPGADYSRYDFKVLDYNSVPVPMRKPYVTGIAEFDPLFLNKIIGVRFGIVHAHCPFGSGLVAQHIARLQRIPLVATFHSKYKDDFARVLPEHVAEQIVKLIILFYKRADLVWVPQESVKDVIREYGYKGEVGVMENGSDLVSDYTEEDFARARRKLGIPDGTMSMLFVGQHIWEKNPRLIIESLARIKDVDYRMFFVGTGYAADEMKTLVKEKGLDGKVSFAGQLTSREALKEYYAAADLFLFPSLYDNAPLVVKEAAALHTPSVMAAGATASTIIRDAENGFLVENDPDAMAALLRRLAANPDLVRSAGIAASRTLVRSWEDIASEVLLRYNDLLRSKGLAPLERFETR